MKYADNEFNIYKATSHEELAMELYKTSFARTYAADLDEFMSQCADRIYEQYVYRLEYTDVDSFIDELIKHNLIVEIN